MASNGKTIAAVERATAVLLLFAESESSTLGVTEIATQLDLSKAVIHRILASLKEADLIHVDADSRRYSLGPATLRLGLAYLDRIDLRVLARPSLERLTRTTNETATLSIRSGDSRIYIDQVTPPREVKMTVPLGRPFPLHAGGSSKAFLAFLPKSAQHEYLSSHPLGALTDMTITDAAQLREELKTIRERGYAQSFGERQAGAGSVAAPVFDHEGNPVAVMSVCGPVERFREEATDVARYLLEETALVSEQLGARISAGR